MSGNRDRKMRLLSRIDKQETGVGGGNPFCTGSFCVYRSDVYKIMYITSVIMLVEDL